MNEIKVSDQRSLIDDQQRLMIKNPRFKILNDPSGELAIVCSADGKISRIGNFDEVYNTVIHTRIIT